MWLLTLVLVFFANVAWSQLVGCTKPCSVRTFTCDNGVCSCYPLFSGDICNSHFWADRPASYYGMFVIVLLFSIVGTVFGVFLIVFYFRRFYPSVKQHNPHIIGLFMASVACFMRFLYSAITLGYGPNAELNFFYIGPNGPQTIMRLTYGLFFPLTIGAVTLQILIWMEFVMAVKSLKQTAATWVPRLRWIFFPLLGLMTIFEIVVQALLISNINIPIVLMVYRGFLAVYIGALMVVAIVGGVRLLMILRSSTKVALESSTNERARRSRRNLTRLVLLTCAFCIIGLAFSVASASRVSDYNIDVYFPFSILLRIFEFCVVYCVLLTFWSMMRTRIAFQKGTMADSDTGDVGAQPMSSPNIASTATATTSSTSSRPSSKRSTRSKQPKDLTSPLLDYSNFGSETDEEEYDQRQTVILPAPAPTRPTSAAALSAAASRPGTVMVGGTGSNSSTMGSLLDAPSSETLALLAGHVFHADDVCWAQYRMDGLWYAARIVQVISDEQVEVQYIDYDLTDTLPTVCLCPDVDGILANLSSDRTGAIKAFDSRPTKAALQEGRATGPLQPDTFGLVRLRGKAARKPNHSSLLLKRGSLK